MYRMAVYLFLHVSVSVFIKCYFLGRCTCAILAKSVGREECRSAKGDRISGHTRILNCYK